VPVQLSEVRPGRVHARYFRENFAQGGFDLAQILPELVTNADAAIAASGRDGGRIVVSFGPPDREFVKRWKRELRALRVPALLSWKNELRCTDDGEGVNASIVDQRLGALGVHPTDERQRGLFGRGLRDVWLAQGGGRIEGVCDGHFVESWFFPAAGDEPYAYVHVRDEVASAEAQAALGVGLTGTRVTVPLANGRLPQSWRLQQLLAQLVQLRPVLEDPSRELLLDLPGESLQHVTYPEPEPASQRPILFDDIVAIGGGVSARIVVRRAEEPFPVTPSRATRRGGLVIRSGRAAHETTLGTFAGRPGARRLYGEVWCETIEELQREALDSPRPQVVVRVDRSGLNENHPMVERLYRAIDRVLEPIVNDEERREGARLVTAGRVLKARDQQGLRALNEALRQAFEAPGRAAGSAGTGEGEATAPRLGEDATQGNGRRRQPERPEDPIRFKQSPMRLHPGEVRGTSLVIDARTIPPGTPISVAADQGMWVHLRSEYVPQRDSRGLARVPVDLRVEVSIEPGTRLTALAEAGGHAAELEVLVVRHTAGGWVREIVRKDEDSVIEAEFDPEQGTVTVYEGRPEFRALERAARKGGLRGKRVREYPPYRQLEVEAAATAVYMWAANQIVEKRSTMERPADPVDFARAIQTEAQVLRHQFHGKLMKAFLDPAVFEGRVAVATRPSRDSAAEPSLL
jgi:hypothetical protein